MSWLISYLIIGLTIYTIVALCRLHTFKKADKASIARGFLFGVLCWPAVPYVLWWMK